jgi:hypothetical protein
MPNLYSQKLFFILLTSLLFFAHVNKAWYRGQVIKLYMGSNNVDMNGVWKMSVAGVSAEGIFREAFDVVD